MADLITFDAQWDAPDLVTRTGKIFELGDYPDKAFALSEPEADAAIAAFQPVPLELEHFLSEGRPSILDGKLGRLQRVWRQGADLFGEVAVPAWLDPIWAETGRKISAVWDRPSKLLTRSGLVLNPRVTDAALYAAFAGARHNHSDQAALDSAHAAIVAAGATCAAASPKEARMSLWDNLRAALEDKPADFTAGETPPPPPDPRVAALERQIADQQAAFAATQATARTTEAVTFADSLVTAGTILPALRPLALALFTQALADDAATPQQVTFSDAAGTDTTGSRADVVRALFTALGTQAATLTVEAIPAHSVTLSATPQPDAVAARQRAEKLMKLTPLGLNALRAQKET